MIAAAIPSFRSSPRIRGEPHRGVAAEMSRIRFRTSLLIAGRPGCLRLSCAKCSRNRRRCQASTVVGWTKTRTSCQRAQCRANHTQTIRSEGRIWVRRTDGCYTVSRCRSATASS